MLLSQRICSCVFKTREAASEPHAVPLGLLQFCHAFKFNKSDSVAFDILLCALHTCSPGWAFCEDDKCTALISACYSDLFLSYFVSDFI